MSAVNLTEQLARLAVVLVNELLGRQSYARDLEADPDGLSVEPWRVVIRLRRKPVILIDPDPAPRPPINRQGKSR